LASLGQQTKGNDHFSRLVAAYSEPHRHYHGATHVEHCLREFESSNHLAQQPDEVEFAIWLHDAVYDPRANDNEEQSAQWAIEILCAFGCTSATISRVKGLILATKQHEPLTRKSCHVGMSEVYLGAYG